MPDGDWWKTKGGVKPHAGKFQPIERWLVSSPAKKKFKQDWLPTLLMTFCEGVGGKFRLSAGKVALELGGLWGYCERCRFTQRPFPGTTRCVSCGADQVRVLDPDTDPVFQARKGYYRASAARALADPPESPMSIIAAEHTAQLNAAQSDAVFSKAEEHELLFQDVDLGLPRPGEQPRAAIDVLVVFSLEGRPQHACDSPEQKAAALFRVRNGKIVLWHQTDVPPAADNGQTI